jgi:hypothetical protein
LDIVDKVGINSPRGSAILWLTGIGGLLGGLIVLVVLSIVGMPWWMAMPIYIAIAVGSAQVGIWIYQRRATRGQ